MSRSLVGRVVGTYKLLTKNHYFHDDCHPYYDPASTPETSEVVGTPRRRKG